MWPFSINYIVHYCACFFGYSVALTKIYILPKKRCFTLHLTLLTPSSTRHHQFKKKIVLTLQPSFFIFLMMTTTCVLSVDKIQRRSRQFWFESENLECPLGFHSLPKKFWPQSLLSRKPFDFFAIKGFSGHPVTLAGFFLTDYKYTIGTLNFQIHFKIGESSL